MDLKTLQEVLTLYRDTYFISITRLSDGMVVDFQCAGSLIFITVEELMEREKMLNDRNDGFQYKYHKYSLENS